MLVVRCLSKIFLQLVLMVVLIKSETVTWDAEPDRGSVFFTFTLGNPARWRYTTSPNSDGGYGEVGANLASSCTNQCVASASSTGVGTPSSVVVYLRDYALLDNSWNVSAKCSLNSTGSLVIVEHADAGPLTAGERCPGTALAQLVGRPCGELQSVTLISSEQPGVLALTGARNPCIEIKGSSGLLVGSKVFVDDLNVPGFTATSTPTIQPSAAPTQQTTETPTQQPSITPTKQPSVTPTQQPTATPTQQPSVTPTQQPTATPTPQPTVTPTQEPTITPTQQPTATPTQQSTAADVPTSTAIPTQQPTTSPTQQPTTSPTQQPTAAPTQQPTTTPTQRPTTTPTQQHSSSPSPTVAPSIAPSSSAPSQSASVPPVVNGSVLIQGSVVFVGPVDITGGSLAVNGSLTFAPGSVITAGSGSGSSVVNVSGSVVIGGQLVIELSSREPTLVTVLQSASSFISGSFQHVNASDPKGLLRSCDSVRVEPMASAASFTVSISVDYSSCGISSGAIAGIVLGTVALGVALVLLAAAMHRRKVSSITASMNKSLRDNEVELMKRDMQKTKGTA